MTTSTSVRIDDETLATIRELSKSEQKSIGKIIADAVKRYEDEKFWTEARIGFERLRADPGAWKEYQDELEQWDTLSNDGLEDEEPYYTEEEAKNEIAAGTTPG